MHRGGAPWANTTVIEERARSLGAVGPKQSWEPLLLCMNLSDESCLDMSPAEPAEVDGVSKSQSRSLRLPGLTYSCISDCRLWKDAQT